MKWGGSTGGICNLNRHLFLAKKYKYTLDGSVERIESGIKQLISLPWHDLSVNLYGRFRNDNSFILQPKITFGNFAIFGIVSHLAILEGRIKAGKEPESSITTITIRPNYLLLFLSGILGMLSLYEIVNTGFSNVSIILLQMAPFFLYFFMLSRAKMKRRFEGMLQML